MLRLPASGCGLDTHLCLLFSVLLHRWVVKAAAILSFICRPESGACVGNWVAVNGAWALLSKNVFQKLFYFRTHRLTWVPQSSCQEDHTDALTGHLLLLAEARLTRSQGDRRHILLLMPMCGKVSPLWLSLWNCAFYSCFMIIKVLQWLVFLLASYNLRQRDS